MKIKPIIQFVKTELMIKNAESTPTHVRTYLYYIPTYY